MNYLMCSVGRRAELMKDFRLSMEEGSRIIATDNSSYAPALYFADRQYIVPTIEDPEYIDVLLNICKTEKINVVMTFIDPEIKILADNRKRFISIGVQVLVPFSESAALCFDKYKMFLYLREHGVRTPNTWGSYEDVVKAIENKDVTLPVFVKPRCGSGSVGAKKVDTLPGLKTAFEEEPSLIAQELMSGESCYDLDADIYVDTISHKPVAIFSKRKISTTIGGANKTISFKDDRLFSFIEDALQYFEFNGPIDADFFYRDGEYYLSEINPRFGGAYLHAYGAGVDFIKLINNNINGRVNESIIGQYDENVVMMMYDSTIIRKMKL